MEITASSHSYKCNFCALVLQASKKHRSLKKRTREREVDHFVSSIFVSKCILYQLILAKIVFLRSWQILFLAVGGGESPVHHRNALKRFLCWWVSGRAKVKDWGENSFSNTSISCRWQLHTGLWTSVSYPQAFELWAQHSVGLTLYFCISKISGRDFSKWNRFWLLFFFPIVCIA